MADPGNPASRPPAEAGAPAPAPELPAARILGIESSCDETAAAVVENGRLILSNVVASQVDLHAQFGGIFPEVASRQHIRTIYPVIEQALQQAHLTLKDVDAIAITRGPGLPGSLVVGMNAAKGVALGSGLPLVGVNHIEAHIYGNWLAGGAPPEFPLICLVVSGGHSELIWMTGHGRYRRLGGTLDDAAGEAFDKVGRLLGLPYPGGPSIQRAARGGSRYGRQVVFEAWIGTEFDTLRLLHAAPLAALSPPANQCACGCDLVA